MTIKEASEEINVSRKTGNDYHKKYLVDQKLYKPRIYKPPCTDQQIKALIRYTADDGTTIRHASSKTNMTYSAGLYHFRKYKNSKNNIPSVIGKNTGVSKQEKANEAIGYIVNDSMTQTDAAYNVGLSLSTVNRHYHRYLKENGYKPPISKNHSIRKGKTYTQEHTKKLIDYIVNDKMDINIASKQLGMGIHTARRYYRQYLGDPQRRIPTPNGRKKHSSHAQIRKLIGYLVNDKMSMLAASIKADLGEHTAKKYYVKYLKDPEYKRIIDKE